MVPILPSTPSTPHPSRSGNSLAFLQWTEADRRHLFELYAAISPDLDAMVHDWHLGLLEFPEIAPILKGRRGTEHLARLQQEYFRSLLREERDGDYFAERQRIGLVHKNVGVKPFWYLAAFSRFVERVRQTLLGQGHDPEQVVGWLGSLNKAVCLDVSLALDAYHRAQTRDLTESNERLRELSDTLEKKNRQLRQQMGKAQESARLKKEFLSRISHELRTPLHGMLGYADLIADGIQGPVTPDQRESLAKIRTHGERLVEMVDQLIDAAKLAAASTASPKALAPDQTIAPLVAESRDAAAAKDLELAVHLADPLPPVMGEARGLVSALRHVLRNAIQYTDRGIVRLAVYPEGDEVCFAVSDTGPGIPADESEHIFEAFFQGSAAQNTSCRGVGLGLTLARETTEKMQGRLVLEKSSPEGSTFVLRLPAAPVGDQ